ncbi:LysR family transcriptional regulator [Paenibacillus radicis (ex Xue et al. 2023)]|uniref:LysR family transcriptional regulator n=1 Tax=Paenibacillus radicis (ex Xue et al. 2023) TaxID=2972489 RepID=A0ABT1YTR0_9BACL|nr:LysR family transcriptional regulator [Paenibacillus radicis (ex Xue et al. 2023)]MCR8636576.1 LysR family transcriptional regulator [Paenibacillus radicis (ex Xue et al. 2023)]
MSAMDQYKVFYYTVKCGSITRAAQELYITQPSASYAIKQLEEQLGVRLLVRKPKGVEMTEEGKVLYHFVEQAYGLILAGERKISEMKSVLSGTIRLGASDSLCKYYLLPFLAEFHKKAPEVRICLSHGKTEDILKRLGDGAIDCGIVHLPVDDRIQVQATKTIQDCFVAGPEYARLADSPLTLKELVRNPFVMLSAHSRSRTFFHAFLHTYGIDVMPDIELGSVDLLIEFVRKGMGVSMLPRDFVKEDLEAGTLFEIKVIEPIPSRSIGVVTLPDGTLPFTSLFFVKELTAHLKPAEGPESIELQI